MITEFASLLSQVTSQKETVERNKCILLSTPPLTPTPQQFGGGVTNNNKEQNKKKDDEIKVGM